MSDPNAIYLITAIAFVMIWSGLWIGGILSVGKMILLLFLFDITLTVEAGLKSDVLMIALLHVVTIPCFFGLIYLDLIDQHRSSFSCFVCGKGISQSEQADSLKLMVNVRYRSSLVHKACVSIGQNDRKTFARSRFRNGIPE